MYNKLPREFKSIKSFDTFVTKLRKFLVEKCYYTHWMSIKKKSGNVKSDIYIFIVLKAQRAKIKLLLTCLHDLPHVNICM
jgi:hypothetical protein